MQTLLELYMHRYQYIIELLKALWTVICLFIKSFLNKTDIITEYRKECDNTAQKMLDCLKRTDEGRDLLAKYEELLETTTQTPIGSS